MKKIKVVTGNHKVSLIIDDLESVQPWKPRQIRVHGVAEIVERAGRFGEEEYLAITPTVSWSFGIEAGVNYQAGKVTPVVNHQYLYYYSTKGRCLEQKRHLLNPTHMHELSRRWSDEVAERSGPARL